MIFFKLRLFLVSFFFCFEKKIIKIWYHLELHKDLIHASIRRQPNGFDQNLFSIYTDIHIIITKEDKC